MKEAKTNLQYSMICDVHVHPVDLQNPETHMHASRLKRSFTGSLFFRRRDSGSMDGNYLAEELDNSVNIDGAVFLAMDASTDGNRQAFTVSNEYVSGLADLHRKVWFGAGINPYRKDAVEILEMMIKAGTCVVKWLPSVQHIDPADQRCLPFYEALAHYRLPLLCHIGNEHFFSHGDKRLNHPERLIPALERGVTVIGAHCGTRMFMHEKCYFRRWKRMALEYENFYGDTSAFILPTRIKYLRMLLADSRLLDKVLYASDLPMKPMFRSGIFQLGMRKVEEIKTINNSFDRYFSFFREMGFPEDFFSRGAKLLRLTEKKTLQGENCK